MSREDSKERGIEPHVSWGSKHLKLPLIRTQAKPRRLSERTGANIPSEQRHIAVESNKKKKRRKTDVNKIPSSVSTTFSYQHAQFRADVTLYNAPERRCVCERDTTEEKKEGDKQEIAVAQTTQPTRQKFQKKNALFAS